MGGGAGARVSNLFIDPSAISKDIPHQPSSLCSPTAPLSRIAWAWSVRSCAFQSSDSHGIRPRKREWDVVLRTLSERSPVRAERYARTGFHVLQEMTMKCKPKSAPEEASEECLSMNSFSLASNATTTFGFADNRARSTGVKGQLLWGAAIFWRIGRWTKIFTGAPF